jgi:hypothetical protein
MKLAAPANQLARVDHSHYLARVIQASSLQMEQCEQPADGANQTTL